MTETFVKEGKTKNVFRREDGNMVLRFKDTVTGHADGTADPGGNQVVGILKGEARRNLRFSAYFFEKLSEAGIPNHYVDHNLDDLSIVVKPVLPFGFGKTPTLELKDFNLEWIYRKFATGSFRRNYVGSEEGATLEGIEITLKHDAMGDPMVGEGLLTHAGSPFFCMSKARYATCRTLVKSVWDIVFEEFNKRGLVVWDFKIELALDSDGSVIVTDEISLAIMRVLRPTRDGCEKPSKEEIEQCFFG